VIRTFHHSDFPVERLREEKRQTVTAVLPTREVADTVGSIVEALHGLDGVIDQILVVDAASEDGTAEIAERLGVEVRQESELVPEFGQALGKGDAMWRALAAARGELIVYLDSDTRDFPPHFATGMLGPLICEQDVRFVKGAFRRPFLAEGGGAPARPGGRVAQKTPRPQH
jgi:glucosyl-3-phosphoglycerate synthase